MGGKVSLEYLSFKNVENSVMSREQVESFDAVGADWSAMKAVDEDWESLVVANSSGDTL